MIKCTTKKEKFKNLTVGKDYDGTSSGDEYVLINDAGIRAKYAKKYFREVPVEIALEDAVTTDISVTQNRITVTVGLGGNNSNLVLSFNQATNSCGITEINGINSFKESILEMWNNRNRNIVGNLEDFFRAVINDLFVFLNTNIPAMCYTMTDAISERHESLNNILSENEICELSLEGHNPNSNNEIIFWVFS